MIVMVVTAVMKTNVTTITNTFSSNTNTTITTTKLPTKTIPVTSADSQRVLTFYYTGRINVAFLPLIRFYLHGDGLACECPCRHPISIGCGGIIRCSEDCRGFDVCMSTTAVQSPK